MNILLYMSESYSFFGHLKTALTERRLLNL